jgi:hypothetical protein
MKRLSLVLLLGFSTLSSFGADSRSVALRALGGDANAVRALREMGQPGVDALFAVRKEVPPATFGRVVDAVCRQRDCTWSGLYWYTDFDAAKREAARTHRPILTLRLLGNLDEELSCANSRFFRTILYPNDEIRAYLKTNYVLHWQSVRPAPVITIEFGNGRKMRRTIAGNSIHYVVNAEGMIYDAIPGLYSPPVFLARLKEGSSIDRVLQRFPVERRRDALDTYHGAAGPLGRGWAAFSVFHRANDVADTRDRRVAAWMVTASKSGGGEAAVLDAASFDVRAFGVVAEWAEKIKNVVVADTIDENARTLIRAKRAATPDPAFRTSRSFDTVMENLERTIAADTKINEEKLRPIIKAQLRYAGDVDGLNEWVYDEVFSTPASDPWIGLASQDYFTGITGEGLIVPQRVAAR